ncbi:MAG: AAA family ATPase [Burkholderiaceae bacterium]|nr:AAA family ATPase [Burkholderiaceae bacterium]
MYSQHFGLSQDPFSIAPDPRYLFMSERHREALAHLLFGVAAPDTHAGTGGTGGGTGGGFVLLTGDIGTGKTTICRCFLEQIPSGCHVAYIFNPKLTVTELLQSICEEFHIAVTPAAAQTPTPKTYIDALNAFLLQSHAAGQSCVLIIDEAQNLHSDVLEQLRLLTNLETNARKLLQIVLIGQPELRTMLARPELEQLAQRVIARFHLDALSESESAHYIAHRLAVAGQTGPSPFDRRALQRIHRLARGVPRRINLLCGRALLGAWANGLDRVNTKVVDKAAAEVFGAGHPAAAGQSLASKAWLLGAAGLLVATALGGVAVYRGQTAPRSVSLVAAPAQTAAARPPATDTPELIPPTRAASAVPPAPAVEPLEALLPQMPGDIQVAWAALGRYWPLAANAASPCAAADTMEPSLQCYRTGNLTVPLLRQLGRPGILTLQADGSAPMFAVMVGLTDQHATLQLPSGPHTVSLIALTRLWRGDFATFWRAPKGYSPAARGGGAAPALAEFASQLGKLDGAPPPLPGLEPQVLDANLKARVRDFQRAHGLKADGQPGPMTYMQLESALGIQQPRLHNYPFTGPR